MYAEEDQAAVQHLRHAARRGGCQGHQQQKKSIKNSVTQKSCWICLLKRSNIIFFTFHILMSLPFSFLEKNRVSVRPEKDDFSDSVAEFMQRNRLKIDLHFRPSFGSLQTPNTEFISKVRDEENMFVSAPITKVFSPPPPSV